MTDLALGKLIDTHELRQVLTSLFAELEVTVIRSWDELEAPVDVVVLVEPNESEFPLGLQIGAQIQDGRDSEAWLRGLARALGEQFGTSAICDGSPYGDNNGPYWSLVFDANAAYLADDLDTTFADGRGGPVKIVRKLEGSQLDLPDAATLRSWVVGRADNE